MIVREQADGSFVLINQNDHAKLSGQMAAHWGNQLFATPAPFESVVRAAAFHDCGWMTYETAPLFDEALRAPPTYNKVPLDGRRLREHQDGIDWLSGIDSCAGALVSRHRTGLWRRRYGVITHPEPPPTRSLAPEVGDFIAINEARQMDAIPQSGRDAFLLNYRLLQIFDLLSLYLCNGASTQHLIAPAPHSYDDAGGATLKLTPAGEDRIFIDPYPFDIQPLQVSYVFRRVMAGEFSDQASFRKAYFGAAPAVRTFQFSAAA